MIPFPLGQHPLSLERYLKFITDFFAWHARVMMFAQTRPLTVHPLYPISPPTFRSGSQKAHLQCSWKLILSIKNNGMWGPSSQISGVILRRNISIMFPLFTRPCVRRRRFLLCLRKLPFIYFATWANYNEITFIKVVIAFDLLRVCYEYYFIDCTTKAMIHNVHIYFMCVYTLRLWMWSVDLTL